MNIKRLLFFSLLLLFSPVCLKADGGFLLENDFLSYRNLDRFFSNNFVLSSGKYSVGTEMYTPRDKRSAEVPDGDRPWDGYTFGEYRLRFDKESDSFREVQFRAGALGDASKAKRLQKYVHNDLGFGTDPRGWDTQNKSEIAGELIYSHNFRSRFASYLGRIEHRQSYGFRAGNVKMLVFMRQSAKRILHENEKFSAYLFAGIGGEVKGFDTHLDGRLFTSNEQYTVESIPFVASTSVGAGVDFNRWSITYSIKYLTDEFEGQDGSHWFGSVGVARELF